MSKSKKVGNNYIRTIWAKTIKEAEVYWKNLSSMGWEIKQPLKIRFRLSTFSFDYRFKVIRPIKYWTTKQGQIKE